MKKALRALVFAPLALIGQQAFAVSPTIQQIPTDITFQDNGCGFVISAHVTGTVVDMSYTDAQGVLHDHQAFPNGIAVITNVVTGKSVTLNISGPAKFTTNPDGSVVGVFTGNILNFVDPDTLLPGLFLLNGRLVFFVDANGVFTSTRTGHKTSVCAMVQ